MARTKKTKPSKALSDPKSYRAEDVQIEFWAKFGVTQSGGSRYERRGGIPRPTAALIVLHELGRIDDSDLNEVMAIIDATVV